MRKKYIVRLTDEERSMLQEVISKGTRAAYKIKHANILLKADANGVNWTDAQLAEAFSTTLNTIQNIRQRFVTRGFETALGRKKRATPPRRRALNGHQEARLIALRCSVPPTGYAKWTLRLLAEKLVELEVVEQISRETIRQTLKKMC